MEQDILTLDILAREVAKDSHFFSLLTQNPTIDRLKHIDPEHLENPPSFRTSLIAYQATTHLKGQTMEKRAGIFNGAGVVSRIIGSNGHYNGDNRHPRISSENFMKLADTVRENEDPAEFQRIPVLFYDRKSGNLLLRTQKNPEEKDFTRAENYLTSHGIAELNVAQRADYIDRIVTHQAQKSKTINTRDCQFNLRRKTSTIMKKIERDLGVVPIYLVKTVTSEEFKKGEQTIRDILDIPKQPISQKDQLETLTSRINPVSKKLINYC